MILYHCFSGEYNLFHDRLKFSSNDKWDMFSIVKLGDHQYVNSLLWSLDGDVIIFPNYGGTSYRWDLSANTDVSTNQQHPIVTLRELKTMGLDGHGIGGFLTHISDQVVDRCAIMSTLLDASLNSDDTYKALQVCGAGLTGAGFKIRRHLSTGGVTIERHAEGSNAEELLRHLLS